MNPYQEQVFATDNPQLAMIMLAFGCRLRTHCPMEWVDTYEDSEHFLRHLEDRKDPEFQPQHKISFNFESDSVPVVPFITAFMNEYSNLNKAFEMLIEPLPEQTKNELRTVVSSMSVRLCRQTLEAAEFLVREIRNFPENAKWDHINGSTNQKCVRIGKRSSAALRAELLSKLS